jgi:replication factor C subunit 1
LGAVPLNPHDEQKDSAAGLEINSRSCLIMDEVDGMSGGDRGGVGAMNILIKKTRVIMFLLPVCLSLY